MAENDVNSSKKKIFYVLDILRKYSDEDHHLKQEDIIVLLERDYALSLERKAISRNISLLKENEEKSVFLWD